MKKIKSKLLATIISLYAISSVSAETLKLNMSEYAHGGTGDNIYIGLSSNLKDLGVDKKDAKWEFKVLNEYDKASYKFDEYGVFHGYVTLIPEEEGMYNIKATLKVNDQIVSDTIKVLVDNDRWVREGSGKIKERTQSNDRDGDFIIDEFDKFPDEKTKVVDSQNRTYSFFTVTFLDPEVITKGSLLRINGSKYSPKRDENVVILESNGRIFNVIPEKSTSRNVWFPYPFDENSRVGLSVGDELAWLNDEVNVVSSDTPLIDMKRMNLLPSGTFLIRGRNLTAENTVAYYDDKKLSPIEVTEKRLKFKIDNFSKSRIVQLKLSSGESKEIKFEVLEPIKVKISDSIKDIIKGKNISMNNVEVGFGLLFMKKYKDNEGVELFRSPNVYQELTLAAENSSSVFLTTLPIAPNEKEIVINQFSNGVSNVFSALNIENVLLEESFIMARKMAANLPAVKELAIYMNQREIEDIENIFNDKEKMKKQIKAITEFNEAMLNKLKTKEYQLNPKVNFKGYLDHVEETKEGLKWMMSR